MYGEILFFILIYVYARNIIGLFSNKRRVLINAKNDKLNKLRNKRFKTMEEQKEFANIVRPSVDLKFNKSFFVGTVLGILKFIFFINIFYMLLMALNITISVWTAIAGWIIVPVAFSFITTKLNLESDNLMHIIRWR